jgi:hypothetical protein
LFRSRHRREREAARAKEKGAKKRKCCEVNKRRDITAQNTRKRKDKETMGWDT